MQFHSIFQLESSFGKRHNSQSIQHPTPQICSSKSFWILHAAGLFDFLGCRHWMALVRQGFVKCKGFRPNFTFPHSLHCVISWSWPAKTSLRSCWSLPPNLSKTERIVSVTSCSKYLCVCFVGAIFAEALPPSFRIHSRLRPSWKGCSSALGWSCRCATRTHRLRAGPAQSCSCSKCCWYSALPHWEVCESLPWTCQMPTGRTVSFHAVLLLVTFLACLAGIAVAKLVGQSVQTEIVLNACVGMQDLVDIIMAQTAQTKKVLVWAVWAMCGTVAKLPLANALNVKGIHAYAGRTGPSR